MGSGPPNLRYSDSDRDCLSCTGFKPGAQTCSMFSDWPVSPELVCDAWKAKDIDAVTDDGDDS